MEKIQIYNNLFDTETRETLLSLVRFFRSNAIGILVLGDLMMDHYILGTATRLSPEAPVPVMNMESSFYALGGAGNVINNLVGLDVEPHVCGTVGNDIFGKRITRSVEKVGCESDGIITLSDRHTTLKSRFVIGNQQLLRCDVEDCSDINKETTDTIISYIKTRIDGLNAVIISDYGKGIITENLIEQLDELFCGRNLVIAIDPKANQADKYLHFIKSHITIMTPNHYEAIEMANTGSDINSIAAVLLKKFNCSNVLITQGKDGMTLFNKTHRVQIEAIAKKVFDVTGAGDTVIAAISLALSAGASIRDAALLSNIAASTVVEKPGTSAVDSRDIVRFLKSEKKLLWKEEYNKNEKNI